MVTGTDYILKVMGLQSTSL